jgi:hypothetical protein
MSFVQNKITNNITTIFSIYLMFYIIYQNNLSVISYNFMVSSLIIYYYIFYIPHLNIFLNTKLYYSLSYRSTIKSFVEFILSIVIMYAIITIANIVDITYIINNINKFISYSIIIFFILFPYILFYIVNILGIDKLL